MAAPIISVVGNLTADPELRIGGSGAAWVSFTVANTQWRRNGEQWEEAGTSFYDVKAFKTLAENISESLSKGDKVIVVGRIVQESWEDKKTGDKRSKFVVTADAVGPDLSKSPAEIQRTQRSGGRYDNEEPF